MFCISVASFGVNIIFFYGGRFLVAGRPYDLTLAALTATRLLHGLQLVASSPRVC